jgi:hypothetical protein
MEEDDLSELEEDDNPNEFRIHDPLPQYREYKRKLSELHSKSGFCIFLRVVTLYFDRDDSCRRDIAESSISERYLPCCWVNCSLTFKQRWYGLTRNKHNLSNQSSETIPSLKLCLQFSGMKMVMKVAFVLTANRRARCRISSRMID